MSDEIDTSIQTPSDTTIDPVTTPTSEVQIDKPEETMVVEKDPEIDTVTTPPTEVQINKVEEIPTVETQMEDKTIEVRPSEVAPIEQPITETIPTEQPLADAEVSPAPALEQPPVQVESATTIPVTPESIPTPASTQTQTPLPTPIPEPIPTPIPESIPVVEMKTPIVPVQTQPDSSSLIRNYLLGLLVKARSAVQTKKQKNLQKALIMFDTMPKVKNNDIEKFLRVSDSTATKYLATLVKQGKIKRMGTGNATFYSKI